MALKHMGLKKILWITDLESTGYANASRMLLHSNDLHKAYDISVFGINHNHTPSQALQLLRSNFPLACSHHTIQIPENMVSRDIYERLDALSQSYYLQLLYGCIDLPACVKECSPDIVLSINDNLLLKDQYSVLRSIGFNGLWLPYMPIDCQFFSSDFFAFTDDWPTVLTMTEFGRKQMQASRPTLKGRVHVLPHALDDKAFYPLKLTCKERLEALSGLLPEGKRWGDARCNSPFVILNPNCNQNRKRLDRSLDGYVEFIRADPSRLRDSMIVFKCSRIPSVNEGGVDFAAKLSQMEKDIPGITNNVAIITTKLPIDKLNTLFNVASVVLNTTSGEGFGMIPCEAALTGRPQIVPCNTSYIEIFGKHIDLLNVEEVSYNEGRQLTSSLGPDSVLVLFKCLQVTNCSFPRHSFCSNIVGESTQDIFTILVSENAPLGVASSQVDMLMGNVWVHHHVNSLAKVQQLLSKRGSDRPPRVQVIMQMGRCMLKQMVQWMKQSKTMGRSSRFCDWQDTHHSMEVSDIDLQEVWKASSVKVGICTVDSVKAKLDGYYQKETKMDSDGAQCRNCVLSSYTKETVNKQMVELLHELCG